MVSTFLDVDAATEAQRQAIAEEDMSVTTSAAKVSTETPVTEPMLEKGDKANIGGGMASTFLDADAATEAQRQVVAEKAMAWSTGATKVSTEIPAAEPLGEKVDKLDIGGGMVFTSLKAPASVEPDPGWLSDPQDDENDLYRMLLGWETRRAEGSETSNADEMM